MLPPVQDNGLQTGSCADVILEMNLRFPLAERMHQDGETCWGTTTLVDALWIIDKCRCRSLYFLVDAVVAGLAPVLIDVPFPCTESGNKDYSLLLLPSFMQR